LGDEVDELAVDRLEPVARRVADPAQDHEAAQREPPVDQVRQRDRGRLARRGGERHHGPLLLDQPDQLGDLGGVAGPLEQQPDRRPVQRRGCAVGEVVAVHEDDVGAELPDLLGRSVTPDDAEHPDPGPLGQRDEIVAHGRVGQVERDPVAARERDVVVQEGVGRRGLDRQRRELPRIDVAGNLDQLAGGHDRLLRPGPVHEIGQDQHASPDERLVDAGADPDDAPHALRAHLARDARVDREPASREQDVRAVDRGRLDRDERVIGADARVRVAEGDDPVEILADLGKSEMAHGLPPDREQRHPALGGPRSRPGPPWFAPRGAVARGSAAD
jgi:hypothetical protein